MASQTLLLSSMLTLTPGREKISSRLGRGLQGPVFHVQYIQYITQCVYITNTCGALCLQARLCSQTKCVKWKAFAWRCYSHWACSTSVFPLHLSTHKYTHTYTHPSSIRLSVSILSLPHSVSLSHTPHVPQVTVMAFDSSEHDDMASSHPACRGGNPYEINIRHRHTHTHTGSLHSGR